MPTFAYTGRGARGVINGEIDAPDRTTAVGELRSRAILVSKIAEKAGGKTPVKLGIASFDFYEIVQGLIEGDEVIISEMTDYQHLKEVKIK